MSLTLGSPQCFAVGILVFCFLGFRRGWRLEVISMGFIIPAIFFLYIGGAEGIASFIFVLLPEMLHILTGGVLFSASMPPPTANQVLISALVALAFAFALGYIIGGRAFPAKTGSNSIKDHFLGIIPGLVTGYALITYASRIFAGTQTIAFGATTPTITSLGNYVVVLAAIAILALIVGLLTAIFRKK